MTSKDKAERNQQTKLGINDSSRITGWLKSPADSITLKLNSQINIQKDLNTADVLMMNRFNSNDLNERPARQNI